MQYYTFTRSYQVPAQSRYEARIKFSRALENNDEDQFYVGTNLPYPKHRRIAVGFFSGVMQLLQWLLPEVKNQVFGYPKYTS